MWAFAKLWIIRLAALRYGFRVLGLMTILPIALLLKTIGLPLLIVLAIVGFPMLLFLFLLGLPVFLVLIVGAALMAMLAMLLPLGLLALKIFLLVVVPIWIVLRVGRWIGRKAGGKGSDDSPPVSDGPIPEPPIP